LDAAAFQSFLKVLPRTRQTARDRSLFDPQRRGGLRTTFAFKNAKDEHGPAGCRQALDLFVQDGLDIVPSGVCVCFGRHRAESRFVLTAPRHASFCFHGCPIGHAVKPVRKGLGLADRLGVSRQNQKCGLKSVFRILFVFQHVTAYAQDHWSMSSKERREGQLIATDGEFLQKLAVIPRALNGGQLAHVLKEWAKRRRGHNRRSPACGFSAL